MMRYWQAYSVYVQPGREGAADREGRHALSKAKGSAHARAREAGVEAKLLQEDRRGRFRPAPGGA